MLDREVVEEQLRRNEWCQRYEHALLKPIGLYMLWLEEEIDKLKPVLKIKVRDGIDAIFKLKKVDNITPTMYMYFLDKIDNKKDKSERH